GWVLVQAASIAFPAFDAPAAALRWLIVAVIAGFPLTLGLTWFIRPHAATAIEPLARRDWILFGLIGLVGVLLAAQLVWSWWRYHEMKMAAAPAQTNPSSISVLPFANLSGDPSKAYFSDGIADQLISELARTPSLRVAARGSSFAFRGKDEDVRTIA